MIIKPSQQLLVAKKPPLLKPAKMRPELAGRYRMVATKPDGSRRVLADWFPNLLTTEGLNHLGTAGVWAYCQVGSGSTAPTAADATLAAYIGSTSTVFDADSGNVTTEPRYAWCSKTYRFAPGNATGNISEVGIGWNANGGLFSRALVLDANGDPTTVTVLADETLDVGYEIRMYPPTADLVTTVTIGGVAYQCTMRAANINSWNFTSGMDYGFVYPYLQLTPYTYDGLIGAITAAPSGNGGGSGTATIQAYSNNSLKRTFAINFSLTQGNVAGGIKSMYLSGSVLGQYQCEFDVKIPKDSTKVMTSALELAWAYRAI